MEPNDSDSWDDYPWIPVEHRPPTPKPKRKNKKQKDLNKGEVPTAYMIRYADDGTKWHSHIDILRPDSPPVEWPEYPDRPLEDDFPKNFSWDQVSDLDEDPVKCLKKLGIPETNIKIRKKKRKMPKKLKEFEEVISKNSFETPSKFVPEVPELIDDDNLHPEKDEDLASVTLFPTTGYGGGVTDRIDDDDYYPRDNGSKNLVQRPASGLGNMNAGPPGGFGKKKDKDVQYNYDEDSGEISTDGYNSDRQQFWKELQQL